MAIDVATLSIRVQSGDVVTADRRLAGLTERGGRAEAMTATLRRAFAGIGFALIAREALGMADAMTNINSRLGLVTSGSAKLAAVQDALFQTSQRARVGLEGTASLYTKLARNQTALGASSADLLGVTETISKAMTISGASTQESSAALQQLGQAMASGTLRGEELNAILEQAPRLAEAIAAGMGVTVGQLRKLGAEGKLTSKEVFDALKGQGAAVDAEFAKMPITVGGAMTQVRNAILVTVGDLDKMTGSSRAVAEALSGVAGGIRDIVVYKDDITAVALAVGGVAAAFYTAQKAAALLTAIQASRWFFGIQAVAAGAATATEAFALATGSAAVAGGGLAAVLGAVVSPLVAMAALATAAGLAIYTLVRAFKDADEAAEEAVKNTPEYVAYLKALGRARSHAPGSDDKPKPAPATPETDTARKLREELALRDLEIAKQNALNAAFGRSSVELALLSNSYDARAERAKNAVGHSAAETAALNRRTDSMERARAEAIRLADAEERSARLRATQRGNMEAVREAQQALELAGLSEEAAARRRVDLEAENALLAARLDFAEKTRVATEEQVATAQLEYDSTVRRIEAERQLGQATVVTAQAREKKKDADDKAERDRERDVRRVAKTASDVVFEALDGIAKKRNPLLVWAEGLRNAANRAVADIIGKKVGSIFDSMTKKGPDVAAAKNAVAAATMNGAADKILLGAQLMAGVRPTGATPTPAAGAGGQNATQETAGGMSPGWQKAIGYAGIVTSAATTGYGLGGAIYSNKRGAAGNYGRGALAGAAGGALAGATIGSVVPGIGTAIGAAVGGAVGLIGGLVGIGNASKQAKKELAELQKTLASDMASLRATVTKDALGASLADVERDREARRKQIEEAFPGGGRNSEQVRRRNEALREMNALEDERIRQLKEEAMVIQTRTIEDYEARRDAATPGNDAAEGRAAFEREQRREREDLVRSFGPEIDAREKSVLAALDGAQAAEHAARMAEGFGDAVGAATASVRNAPSGLWIEQYLKDFAERAKPAGMATGFTPSGGAAVNPIPVGRPTFSSSAAPAAGGTGARPAQAVTIHVDSMPIQIPDGIRDPIAFAKKMIEGVRRLTDLTGINMTLAEVMEGTS